MIRYSRDGKTYAQNHKRCCRCCSRGLGGNHNGRGQINSGTTFSVTRAPLATEVSYPRTPLLPPFLHLQCGLELPTTKAETRTRASQVRSAPANDSSTVMRHTRPVRRQHCRGHLRSFRKMLVYLLPACPITQHKLSLFRAHGLLRRLSHILTVQYRRREPVSRARLPSARVQFRRTEHAHRAPFSSAMVRVWRREPALTAPFP